MQRLSEKNISPTGKLIKKLELLIVQDKITNQELDNIQNAVDKIDEDSEETDFQLFELQSIIHYARNEKKESLGFMDDALSINSNVAEYSKLGALIAEVLVESMKKAEHFDNTEASSLNGNESNNKQKILENEEKNKQLKELRKKYNGKLEGWLSLYSLRIVFIPIVYLIDIISVIGEDINSYIDEFRSLLYAAIGLDVIVILCSFILWYFYFNKKQNTIFYAKLLEIIIVVYHLAIGLWLNSLYQQYSIPLDNELMKFPLYGLVALLWLAYWYKSKRVIATFIKK